MAVVCYGSAGNTACNLGMGKWDDDETSFAI